MTDKLQIQDLTILFVCPSRRWGTVERRAIADSVFFRDMGGNSIIFCIRNSMIDSEAKRQDIQTIYYDGKKVNKYFDLNYLRGMRSILRDNRFDLIHCYNLKYIWSLSLLLKRKTNIPLFLTYNRHIKQMLNSVFHKWLFTRVDMVLTLSYVTLEMAKQVLPVSLRKLRSIGLGLDVLKQKERESKSEKVIGAFITKTLNTESGLNVILNTVNPLLIQTQDLSFDLKFVFLSGIPFNQYTFFSRLTKKIDELGIRSKIEFIHIEENREKVIRDLDLYIGTEFNEPLNDFEMQAIVSGIPVLMPKTAFRQKIIEDYGAIAETYSENDSRELRKGILKILLNESSYHESLDQCRDELIQINGIESYISTLTSLYEKLSLKRSQSHTV